MDFNEQMHDGYDGVMCRGGFSTVVGSLRHTLFDSHASVQIGRVPDCGNGLRRVRHEDV